MQRHTEYKVTDRLTLRRGDFFRVGGGPWYTSKKNGKRRSMAVRGVVQFMYYVESDKGNYIEAYSAREGSFVVLSLTYRADLGDGFVVSDPYFIRGGVSEKRKAKLIEKAGGKRMLPAARGRRGAIPTARKSKQAPVVQQKSEAPRGVESGKQIMQTLFDK